MSTRPRPDRTNRTRETSIAPTLAASALVLAFSFGSPAFAPRAASGQTPGVGVGVGQTVKPPTAVGDVKKTAAPKDDRTRPFKSLAELDEAYVHRQERLEKERLADLNDLAARQTGAEAEATYRQLFDLAMAHNEYESAEKAARRYQSFKGGDRRTKSLATLIVIVAHAQRGEYDRSLAELESFLKRKPIPEDPAQRLDPQTVFALGEAYLNRLTQAGRYDIAKKVCELGAKHPDKAVREHFEKRVKLFDMIGKPAPDIDAKDVDGETIRLADFKGKVVVVDFWATWCPPCIARMPGLSALREKYRSRGFEVLGVNLDSVREDLGGDSKKALPVVRRFILSSRIGWPNVIDDATVAKAYNVFDIPASFLIDREGNIRAVDLFGPSIDQLVETEVAKKK